MVKNGGIFTMEGMLFADKQSLHTWLVNHHDNHPGIWIRFDKTHINSSLTPEEALDEALCFGWIDGQIKRIDEQYYLKYFTKRSPKSVWSTKNKTSIERLTKDGKMMPSGIAAVTLAKSDGRWDKADLAPIDYSFEDFIKLISENSIACANYLKMSPSVQKTYAISYYIMKKPESRQRRLAVIIDRLERNLKPM